MNSYPLRSNEVGGMTAGSGCGNKRFCSHMLCLQTSLVAWKRAEKWGCYLVVSYCFVPCTFRRDFSNGVEYFEGSEDNSLSPPPEAFIKTGVIGYKYEYKRYKRLSKYYTYSWSR